MAQTIIEVKDLVKRYKKAKDNAVDGISFSVREGEFFAFLGPNGAGKTTTISILTTTLAKTSGEVKIAGYDLEKNAAKVREQIGVIFQNPSLDLNLTAEENIRFHALLYGLYPYRPAYRLMPEDYQMRVGQLAAIIGIKDEIFKPVKTFSGGMKRKLEIIRSLTHRPRVLYLDEPTSGLDPASRKNLWSYLRKVREEEKTTIFLTTHYLEEAEDADRVAIINRGKIIALGSPTDIKKDLVTKCLMIDAADRNRLKAELDRMGVTYREDKYVEIETGIREALKILRRLKTELTYFNLYNPTLEEAYLDLVGNEENT